MDEMSSLSSPTSWNCNLATAAAFAASSFDRSGDFNRLRGVKPTNLDDVFGSIDPAILPQFQGLSLDASASQAQSPTGMQMRQNMNQQLRSTYPTSLSSSPARASSSMGIDPSGASAAAAVLSSRAAAFAKRSQSFIDRSTVNHLSGLPLPASSANVMPSNLSDWGSPDGKLDWGIQKDELNKLRNLSRHHKSHFTFLFLFLYFFFYFLYHHAPTQPYLFCRAQTPTYILFL
ncbi:hypothetical protein HYC85_004331 [Camellia sinensis]|uniref:Uncharacterized protein n=1 Tax=Camellia sinensis TaxID=4442 RepID=A0A7J7HY96_CAMSI|nr:hypothetical protein HYC85_004331 [Camellia sinensis]